MSDPTVPVSAADRLLVIRLGAVGDVLRTLPALHLIRRTYASVHVAWIVEDLSRDLLEGHPEIDQVIRFPRREFTADARRPHRLAARLGTLGRELRRHRFTIAVDFQGSLKSGMLSLLSGAKARLGFAPGHAREMSSLFANRWVRPRSRWMNRVERNLLMSEALGASGDEIIMDVHETEAEGREAQMILRHVVPGVEPLVVLSPGTSRRQAYKRWPVDRFARLAVRLRDRLGAVSLVAWGPGEEGMASDIVRSSGGAAVPSPAIGLRVLAALLRRASLFVGADTGPMHLAWGVGCPVVALFGPTDPRLNAPLGENHIVLCGDKTTDTISTDEVFGAVRDALERSGGRLRSEAPRLSRSTIFAARSGGDA